MDKKSMAEKIIDARKAADVSTQVAAAKLIGVNIRTYQRWEAADTTPDTASLIKISKAFNISLDELMG